MAKAPEDMLRDALESGDNLEFAKALKAVATRDYLEAEDPAIKKEMFKQMQNANLTVIKLEGQKQIRPLEEEKILEEDAKFRAMLDRKTKG